MARYTGPKTKISRRFGIPIFGPSKYLERRNYGPGMHGPRSRRKNTEYALGLMEKQKFRYFYGLQEKQFRAVYETARRRKGVTGETMLQILETRLDNAVFQLGFASSRPAARQMVGHGHVLVNGKKSRYFKLRTSGKRHGRNQKLQCIETDGYQEHGNFYQSTCSGMATP